MGKINISLITAHNTASSSLIPIRRRMQSQHLDINKTNFDNKFHALHSF